MQIPKYNRKKFYIFFIRTIRLDAEVDTFILEIIEYLYGNKTRF